MDVALVTAWKAICQELAPAFSAPTFITFLHVCTGWVLCRSRPTVTNLICTVGDKLFGPSGPAGILSRITTETFQPLLAIPLRALVFMGGFYCVHPKPILPL